MKTIRLTILGLVLAITANAQNWKILNPEVTYYYSHSDSIHLTNTINIDSMIVDGENEISYISNKYKVCDTCDFNPNYEVIIHRYAEEFLGFDVSKQIEGNYYMINEDTVSHQSNVGENWNFNNELTATTTSIVEDEFLGEIDSLKTIILSSSDTIILSINHGIIRYPDFENEGSYYELKGYHDNEWYYGEVFPNFWSIYDFAVGDEYCGEHGWQYMEFDYHKKQIEILSLLSITETEIVYETTARGSNSSGFVDMGELGGGWSNTNSFNINSSTETFHYIQGANEDFFGVCKNELYLDQNEYTPGHFQTIGGFFDISIDKFVVQNNEYSEEFGYIKKLLIFDSLGDSLLYANVGDEDFYSYESILVYANRLGRLVYLNGLNGFVYYESRLNGAVISGDTILNFCNIPFDLDVENLEIKPLSIHPNPASSQITINRKFESLEVFSQTGQLVLKIEEQINVIDVRNLSPGIYFLKAINEEKLYTTKLIIE